MIYVMGSQQEIPFCCGVVEFGEFDVHTEKGWYDTLISELSLGHANLAVAAFIDTDECRMAYENLKDRFHIAFQSTVRQNTSGNMLFLVVYDGAKKRTRK